MQSLRVVSLILGALALGSTASFGQTVVDANGRTVGTLYGHESSLQTQTVLRRISSSISIAFPIVRDGIYYLGFTPQYNYASADCSGPAYLENDMDVLVQRAFFIPPNQDDRWSTKGLIIYGGTPRVRLAIYSARSKFNYNIGDGPCTPYGGGEMMTVRPVVEQDIASWRLTAPFKIK